MFWVNEMWIILFLLTIFLLSHVADLRIRGKIMLVVNQKTPIGHIETWLNALHNRYKYHIFARRRDFYAELLFTEKAIIIFRMLKLGPIKLRSNVMVLAKSFEDIPQINDFWYRMQTGMLYRIDSIVIDGRRILLECTYIMPSNEVCNRTILHKFVISDLRDNDSYKNVLLLQRHLQEHKIY